MLISTTFHHQQLTCLQTEDHHQPASAFPAKYLHLNDGGRHLVVGVDDGHADVEGVDGARCERWRRHGVDGHLELHVVHVLNLACRQPQTSLQLTGNIYIAMPCFLVQNSLLSTPF